MATIQPAHSQPALRHPLSTFVLALALTAALGLATATLARAASLPGGMHTQDGSSQTTSPAGSDSSTTLAG